MPILFSELFDVTEDRKQELEICNLLQQLTVQCTLINSHLLNVSYKMKTEKFNVLSDKLSNSSDPLVVNFPPVLAKVKFADTFLAAKKQL